MNTYITTPIYYASGSPHLGHAYTTLLADAYGRYLKLRGNKVLLLTGTDEHGQKIERTAAAKGVDVGTFVDQISQDFEALWRDLKVDIDIFQRTTDLAHAKVVLTFWQRLKANGDLYIGDYSGLYCVECEQYFTTGTHCPTHKIELEKFAERCWFFRLSRYQEDLIDYIEAHDEFIVPVQRRNEVLSFLKLNQLRDLAVSRGSTSWGIPVPGDESQVLYVWVDALVTYLSGLEVAAPDVASHQTSVWWKSAHHFIGKDILIFHAVYWPALLWSAGYQLPASLVVNGWLTVESEKISKSRPATVIDPRELEAKVGIDGLRHYLFSRVGLGQDLDFSFDQVVEVANADLANNIGNFVSRMVGLVEKYEGGVLTASAGGASRNLGPELATLVENTIVEAYGHLDNYEFAKASRVVVSFSSELNAWLQKKQPWKLDNAEIRRDILWQGCLALRTLSILLIPFTPDIALKIQQGLGLPDNPSWSDLYTEVDGFKTDLPVPVFKRVEVSKIDGMT